MKDSQKNKQRIKKETLSRRNLLKKTAAGTLGIAGFVKGFPYIHASGHTTLRYMATGVSQHTQIAAKAKEELGINIEYMTVTSDEEVKKAVTQPSSFDIMEPELWMVKKIVPSGQMQAMDVNRLHNWDKVTTAWTKGEVNGKKIGEQGTAPITVMYVTGKNSKRFSKTATDWATLMPTTYNADTLGIRPDLIGRPIEHWHELLNPEFAGKASILNIPSIGIMDAAMVVESLGEYTYPDKGNMTKKEIDLTMAVLTKAKKRGQFRAFWKEFNESVNLMASGEVVIQSMWSPAVTKVRSMGIPCIYQPLKEGARAWGAGMAFPRTLKGKKLDAAYEFVNWYTSGWAGAFLFRQGYYSGVLSTAQKHMDSYEWDYWMLGKPAKYDIKAPDGTIMEKVGSVRDGGSFNDRMGAVACWNAVMDENRYMIRKWNEFIAA